MAPECQVRLNNSDTLDGRVLSVADLRPGDQATISHDARVMSIDATRVVQESGVVQSVQAKILTVQIDGQNEPREFLVDATCRITLAGDPAPLEHLRRGDLVVMSHDAPSPGTPNPRALAIAARRSEDSARWAIVIGMQNYDDATLGSVPTRRHGCQQLRDALVKRHAVPTEQALALTDPSLVQLQQGIASLLERVRASDELIVYYAGRAVRSSRRQDLPCAEGIPSRTSGRDRPEPSGAGRSARSVSRRGQSIDTRCLSGRPRCRHPG